MEANNFGEEEPGVTSNLIGNSAPVLEHRARACGAASLRPAERSALAVDVLGGRHSISALARERDVSRKFVYEQAGKAQEALDRAFSPRRRG